MSVHRTQERSRSPDSEGRQELVENRKEQIMKVPFRQIQEDVTQDRTKEQIKDAPF